MLNCGAVARERKNIGGEEKGGAKKNRKKK